MGESARQNGPEELSESLVETRLLTEVDHLLNHRRPDGSFDQAAEQDVQHNLMTGVQETAMPYAVTTSIQRVTQELDAEGRMRRMVRWLGKSAVDVAESGYNFHFSEPAFARVGIEVKEAGHSQEAVRDGIIQVFISPKMSPADAPKEVAEKEHLYDDDAVRTTAAIVDAESNIVAHKLQSLLVRDIPLSAWVTMLRDPGNIFGKAFELRDEQSALSVMELFDQLELPEGSLPNGPVDLVDAVAPYIQDMNARASVELQLVRFKTDQEAYQQAAEVKAAEWLAFEKQLAESLHTGRATFEVKRFIFSLQDQWGAKDLAVISNHCLGDTEFIMTRQLAARLEKAKQNLLKGIAAIQTGNDKVLDQMDAQTARALREEINFIETLRVSGIPEAEYALRLANLNRQIAIQNLSVSGGCSGNSKGEFNTNPDDITNGQAADGKAKDETDPKNWKWKRGICQVKACSSPKPTEVGPCDVCRNCQHQFDKGEDPTKAPVVAVAEKQDDVSLIDELLRYFSRKFEEELDAPAEAGELTLSGDS